MTIKEAQTAVDEWIKTYGVRYFNELTNMVLLTEEVGELARIIARTYGEQSFKESDKGHDMADEMADILWVLMCLANQTGVDLTEAFAKNMEKKTSRGRYRHQQPVPAMPRCGREISCIRECWTDSTVRSFRSRR